MSRAHRKTGYLALALCLVAYSTSGGVAAAFFLLSVTVLVWAARDMA